MTVNTYLFKYVPVKLGFIILSIIGVLRIPEEFYLYKDKDKDNPFISSNSFWTNVCLLSMVIILHTLGFT